MALKFSSRTTSDLQLWKPGCTTAGGGGAAAIEQLAKEHGYRAVRFNPYLWPEGEKMTNEVGVTGRAHAGNRQQQQ